MSDLTDFLLARIAEDEAVAQAVVDSHEMWGWEAYVAQAGMYQEPASEFAERFHPARVLAECAAKRRIVELHGGDYDGECQSPARLDGPCRTLRALATPYADHPDYREEWAL